MERETAKVEVVEVYVPRQLVYLSALYSWLKEQLEAPQYSALLRGFSLYEVSGAFAGSRVYTEQTLVIRLVFEVPEDLFERAMHETRVSDIADAVAQITRRAEEEIWLIRSSASRTVRRQGRIIHAARV